MFFKPGTLRERLVQTTTRALATGALVSIPTDFTFLDDEGVRFLIRILASLNNKEAALKKQKSGPPIERNPDPFLPPEQDLFVADISDTHAAVLNKYNVVDHHLLIITKHFEDQDTLLTRKDFEALWLCLAEYDGLGFYNAGPEAGASQQHKHLQLVPIPLAPAGAAIPIEPLLPRSPTRTVSLVPRFPFFHSFARLDRGLVRSPIEAALQSAELYSSMLAKGGMATPSPDGFTRQSLPYCLLITRDWMLLIPRSKESFENISLNSLAYAGCFFVQNTHQLETLRQQGPMKALIRTSFPRKI
jgi:sulfate adenylyltransferase (ADP) / ATP adenylyltransferase